MPIASWEKTDRFGREYGRLDPALQTRVDEVLRLMVPWPSARSLRHHSLSGYKPPIHVVDVTTNKSHQMTFTVTGSIAKLLRVATHKEIDRAPG